MEKQFPDVHSRYGAPMGRPESPFIEEGPIRLFRVRMVDGDYDDGGAYWGGGPTPLWCGRDEEGNEQFVRAKSWEKAAEALKIETRVTPENHSAEQLAEFFDAYVDAALWAETDSDGEPFAANFSRDDFSPACLATMHADCEKFLREFGVPDYSQARYDANIYSDHARAGHDFWLTRNEHGAGFSDRGLPEDVADKFTKAARSFGEVYLYVGDDMRIHCD